MQVRQIFFFTVGLIFLFLPKNAFSQKVMLNEYGEKIVLYPDGSWHFYKEGENVDSTVITTNTPLVGEEENASKGKKQKKEKSKKKKSKGKKSENIDADFELAEKRKAVQRAERAAAIEEAARLSNEEAIFKRIFLEEELEEAYQSIDLTHEDIAKIEDRLKKAKKEESDAKANYKAAQNRSKDYEKMIEMPSGKRKKLLAKIGDNIPVSDDMQSPRFDGLSDEMAEVSTTPDENAQQDIYETIATSQRPPVRAYDPKRNLLRFPPARPCELAYDDVDEFSGKKRKQTQKTFFFSHTPERFRSYFKGREYMICSGTLIAVDGTPRSINIEFTIATDQASREFGILEKGSQLILRLIDGSRLILVNNKTATGIVDPVTKTTTYATSYPLSKAQIKTLMEAEVDKVRMIWATGYEDYEVYQVDFFKDLFRCLEEG